MHAKIKTRLNAFRRTEIAASIAAALAVPIGGHSIAAAQEAQLEEIFVTGSRIVRRDFEANSPIQTVESEMFEQVSTVGIEAALNQLPQFIPAATQFVGNTPTAATGSTLTAGASTLSLRGLAPNRNLVLLDGRRAMPVNATMAVDINTIPSSAIERVEVITGGASSVYGADAVAGVVNFILKRDFEGAEFDLQYGAREAGDGGESRLSALFGANLSDGRGNVLLGVEYAGRQHVDRADTDFFYRGMIDPTVSGTQLIHPDSYYQLNGTNPPSGAAVDAIFNQAPPGTVLRGANGVISAGRLSFNTDGTLYTGAASFGTASPQGPGSANGAYRYNGPTTWNGQPFRKLDAQGEWEEEIPGHRASLPLQRFSLFSKASFEVLEGLSAFAQVSAVESKTEQLWAWTPATGSWSASIPFGDGVYAPSLQADGVTTADAYLAGGSLGLSCAPTGGCSKSEAFPTPPELTALLRSRVNPEANWDLHHSIDYSQYGADAPPREIDTSTRTLQLSFGFEGDVPSIDGSWDAVVSHGSSLTQLNQNGYIGVESYRDLVQSPNYGTGFFRRGNPQGNGFSAGIARCTSGLPIFRDHGDVTQDCIDAFMRDIQNNAEMLQDFLEANIQGRLVQMPAGEARFAGGTAWRRNEYSYRFDTLSTQNSFRDVTIGTWPADNTYGETSVKELYGELFLPLVADVTAVQHLNLELGYRYSDYELQGGVDTYKALIDWGINDQLRFRGGRQLATRAPNIAELFQAKSQAWGTGVGDMCGLLSRQPNSANPTVNPNAARSRAICEALMGQEGAANFYDPANPQPNGFSGIWFANTIGNPQVQPEEAVTRTAGFVYQPASERAWLDNLTMSVDWYSIDIEDMITVEADSAVYNACLSVASNPSGDITHPACTRIIRNPTSGGSQAVDVSYTNKGRATIEGVDLQANWQVELSELGLDAPGAFGVNFMISGILKYETQSSPTEPIADWKGTLGPGAETSLNGGAYDYRTFLTFNYGLNDMNFSLRWRHLPKADPPQAVFARGALIPELGAESSYDIFDFATSWRISDRYQLRGGIDNLFDADPVITGGLRSVNGSRPTSGAGTTIPGFYDVLGRRFYLGFNADF